VTFQTHYPGSRKRLCIRSVEDPQDVSCIQFIEVGSFFQWEMRWSSDDAFMTKFSEASNVCWVTVPRNPSVAGNQPCWPWAVSWTCQVWKCLGTVFLSLDSCCIPDALATRKGIFLCLVIVEALCTIYFPWYVSISLVTKDPAKCMFFFQRRGVDEVACLHYDRFGDRLVQLLWFWIFENVMLDFNFFKCFVSRRFP